jgi:hypothetical protein
MTVLYTVAALVNWLFVQRFVALSVLLVKDIDQGEDECLPAGAGQRMRAIRINDSNLFAVRGDSMSGNAGLYAVTYL